MAQTSNSKQMKPGIAKKKAKDIVATLDEAAMLQQLRKQFAKHAAKKEEHKQLVERRISHLKAQVSACMSRSDYQNEHTRKLTHSLEIYLAACGTLSQGKRVKVDPSYPSYTKAYD